MKMSTTTKDAFVTPTKKKDPNPCPPPLCQRLKECSTPHEVAKAEFNRQTKLYQIELEIPEDLLSKDAYEKYADAYKAFKRAGRLLDKRYEVLHLTRELSFTRDRIKYMEGELLKKTRVEDPPKRHCRRLFAEDET